MATHEIETKGERQMSILETTSQVCLMVQSVVISYIGYGHLFKPDGNLSELGFTYRPRSVSSVVQNETALMCVALSIPKIQNETLEERS